MYILFIYSILLLSISVNQVLVLVLVLVIVIVIERASQFPPIQFNPKHKPGIKKAPERGVSTVAQRGSAGKARTHTIKPL